MTDVTVLIQLSRTPSGFHNFFRQFLEVSDLFAGKEAIFVGVQLGELPFDHSLFFGV